MTQTFELNGVNINSSENGVFLADIMFSAGGTINATIIDSELTAGAGFDEIRAEVDQTGVQNLNLSDNELDDGDGTIRLDRQDAASAINVTQGAPGAGDGGIDDENDIPAANVIIPGFPIIFDAPAPPLP